MARSSKHLTSSKLGYASEIRSGMKESRKGATGLIGGILQPTAGVVLGTTG